MGRQQGQYSGVPTTTGNVSDDITNIPVVPVASAVALDSSSHHSSTSTSEGLPTASKLDSSTNQSGNPTHASQCHIEKEGNKCSYTDDEGVKVEWERGEVQPSAFRDKWFAVVFVGHLLAVIGTAISLGPSWMASTASSGSSSNGMDGGEDGNGGEEMNDDRASDYNGNSNNNENDSPPPTEFWYTVIAIALLTAPTLSLLSLSWIKRNAQSLIRTSLYFSVFLCGASAVAFLVIAPFVGILYAILTAFLVCYARSVQHKIPYAAANLKAGIEVIKSNLGLGLVAAGAVVGLVAYSATWIVAFGSAMDQEEMKAAPIDGTGSYSGSSSGQDQDLSGLGVFVALSMLLCLYWTHEVLKNVVRTSVAGVVGTWWFSPLEASSFCSVAVRDSFVRSTTYSLGSICFGSLIVAVLHLLRNILRNAQNDNRNGGAAGSILRCIAVCILAYLEAIVEYFNKWAYLYVGLYGYDYIGAGKRVMGLFKNRGWEAVIADNLVNRLLGIVSLTIGLLSGVATLLAALIVEEVDSQTGSGWLGAGFVIGFVLGLMLSGIILGLVSSAVDGVIVLYAEAPQEFGESHPALAQEMHDTWTAAWPNLNFGGPVVISLGGGLGLV